MEILRKKVLTYRNRDETVLYVFILMVIKIVLNKYMYIFIDQTKVIW